MEQWPPKWPPAAQDACGNPEICKGNTRQNCPLCRTIRKGGFGNTNGRKLPFLPSDASVSNALQILPLSVLSAALKIGR
jgi:hypothetical protein